VQYATSHFYEDGLDSRDYIEASGGMTARADGNRTYIVRANGGVVSNSGSRFFRRTMNNSIRSGDTVVVSNGYGINGTAT